MGSRKVNTEGIDEELLLASIGPVSYTHLGTNIRYLAEATPDTADYINGLLRMHAMDEIILYTVPFISGSG